GGAFGQIVTALVDEVIMRPLGELIGNVDCSDLGWTRAPARVAADGSDIRAVVSGYGEFLNTVSQLLIVAFATFMPVKGVNRLARRGKQQEEAPAAPPERREEVLLLRQIRDALQQR